MDVTKAPVPNSFELKVFFTGSLTINMKIRCFVSHNFSMNESLIDRKNQKKGWPTVRKSLLFYALSTYLGGKRTH